MAYVIPRDTSVPDAVRRIIRKQLKLAIAQLSTDRQPSDGIVHEARRHIKKARAALRLCRASLRPAFRASNRRLRRAARLLAPVSDGEAVVRTFTVLASQHRNDVPAEAVAAIQRYLDDRQAAVHRRAARHRVLRRVVDRLTRERAATRRYRLGTGDSDDDRQLAVGYERTIRRSRAAMARVVRRGTADHFHDWRRRVKDHWLQARLLSSRCSGRLMADEQQLDQLDALLGRCHDLALLADALRVGAPLPRDHAAAWLRIIRQEQSMERRAAVALGRALYDRADAELTYQKGRARPTVPQQRPDPVAA